MISMYVIMCIRFVYAIRRLHTKYVQYTTTGVGRLPLPAASANAREKFILKCLHRRAQRFVWLWTYFLHFCCIIKTTTELIYWLNITEKQNFRRFQILIQSNVSLTPSYHPMPNWHNQFRTKLKVDLAVGHCQSNHTTQVITDNLLWTLVNHCSSVLFKGDHIALLTSSSWRKRPRDISPVALTSLRCADGLATKPCHSQPYSLKGESWWDLTSVCSFVRKYLRRACSKLSFSCVINICCIVFYNV